MKTHCIRLTKGQDILIEIKRYCETNSIKASVILSSVGCVTMAAIRDAGGNDKHFIQENMEILSLNGTASMYRIHLHIAFSKKDLSVIGGHLLEGCMVNTTCELVLMELDDVEFRSEFDDATGYDEIDIRAV